MAGQDVAVSSRHSLKHEVYVTPSGLLHPYYRTEPPTDCTAKDAMLARVSVYPPLDHETLVTSEDVCLLPSALDMPVTDELYS